MPPPSYRPASLRCVLNSDGARVGIAFDVEGAEQPVRLALDVESARRAVSGLLEMLTAYQVRSMSQSPISSGSPSSDGSPQAGQSQ